MATATFYPSVDGYLWTFGSHFSWVALKALGGSNATLVDTWTDLEIGVSANSVGSGGTGLYDSISRGILIFNTSSLGTPTITDGTLSVYGADKYIGLGAPSLNVYNCTTLNNGTLVVADYDTLGTTSYSTPITYANFGTAGYNNFLLNGSGLANITGTGFSKFALQEASFDIANVEPTWAPNSISELQFYSTDYGSGTAYFPKLVVTYLPTVTTQSMRFVAHAQAMARGTVVSLGAGITAYGFCWGTATNPTIADSSTTMSGSAALGEYQATIGVAPMTPLTPSTRYYVRAFASDGGATFSYGNNITFVTTAGPAGHIWMEGANLHGHDTTGTERVYINTDDVDDTPVNGVTTFPVSSNWAFDHVAATDPHTGYRLESADHSHQSTGLQAGQLDHGLSMVGSSLLDDDHTQYQKESEKGTTSGYASLNGSTLVVENPANATATPTASKIPIADGSGLLDGWVTISGSAVVEPYSIKWALVTGG